MSKKYEKPDRNPEETEDVRKMTGEAKRTPYLGIKGCPADLFLTEKAKRILMAQGDWYKVNRESPKPKLDSKFNIREKNNTGTTKESFTESLLDSVKPHLANGSIRQNVAPASDGPGGEIGGSIEFKDEKKKKGIPHFLRRIFDVIRKPSTCLNFPRKRNKVGIVFDDIQSH